MRWNKVIYKWNSLFLFSALFLIFSAQLLVSQNVNIRFDQIDTKNGLFSSTIFCIFQDSKGFMWFGLQEGLNRYDGRSFIIYNESNTEVEDGIFGNIINDIGEDRNGKIWIGTDRGLLKFDPTLEKFDGIADWKYDRDVRAICVDGNGSLWVEGGKNIIEVHSKEEEISIGQSIPIGHEVHDICRGDNGELWIGTENGLFKLGSKNVISATYLEGESISKIYKDSAKTVWVGTEDGKLFKYNGNKEFDLRYENYHEIGLNAICEDNEKKLWLGFNGDGIVIYSKEEKACQHIKKNFYVPGGLKDNFVQCIIKDNAGTMWIGTHSVGVNKYNPNKFKFKSYFNDPRDNNSLSGRSIFSIFEDNEGYIWIGTYDGELDKFNPRKEKFKSFDNGTFKGESILSINEDTNGWLWIGTSEDLYRADKNKESRKFIPIKDRILGRNIRIIKKDHDKLHFWIGTGEKGVFKFNPLTERIVDIFSKDSKSKNKRLSDNNIYYIFPDNEDNSIIWVGTAKGLNKVNKSSRVVSPIIFKDKQPEVNKERRIFYILPDPDPDKKEIFWLGTDSSGLCKFKKGNNYITSFTIDKGLPNNTVYGIFTDEQGYLWFSTNKGIVQFDPKEEKVKRTFDVNDGLQENEFNHGAHCESHSGHMYFGGVRGLSVFHPSEIEEKIDKKNLPQIYFTKLRIGDRKVEIGKDEYFNEKIIQKSITETKEFELDYKHQPFTLEFAALDYNVPGRIKYKCKLWKDGMLIKEVKWIPNNFHTFSNLNSGRYTFKIWSTNSDITNTDDTIIDKYFKNQTPAVEIEIIIKKHLYDRLKPIIMPLLFLVGIASIVVLSFYIAFKTRTKKRIKQLEMIETAIDDVSKHEETADFAFRMLDYIIKDFGFDYAAISIINFLNSTISTIYGKTQKPNLIKTDTWKSGFKCKLNEENYLTQVVRKREPIEVVGLNKKLKKNVLKEDEQADLIRVFVPIEFRTKDRNIERDEANIVFGVVEAGFHGSTRSNIPKESLIILELFLSYCSGLFHRALLRSEKQIVENLLNRSSEIEEHKEYLERVLTNSVKLIGGDKGDISFFSFNEKEINISDSSIFYNFYEEDKELVKRRCKSDNHGIVRHVAETEHYYYTNDVKNDAYYIEEFQDVNSELALPMRYYGRVIAVLNIYSTERDFFDDRKANIIQIIADEAAKSFQNKKINQTIKNLVIPFELFAGIEKIYGLILQNIKDYFMTELVSIWEKAEIGDEGEYKLFIARDTLKEKYAEFGIHSLKQDIFKTKREIQLLNFDHNPRDCGFNVFVGKYDLKSMIIVPIIIDQQVYGFINIFSKRELPSLFPEEITFLNLVATKGAISVQYEKLISSFMEISDSLPSENLDRILGNIAGNARRVLHADPVILFRYDQTQENFEATFSGYLFHPDIKKDLRHYKEEDHLVTYIISKGSVWFENSDDYQEYVKEIGRKHKGIHFKEDFWTREKIKSSAGVRLEHNDEPIGVMFFNYREEQSFDRDTRRFIEVFSSLASSAIVNARYLDLIEKQRKKLGEQKGQLEMQKEKLEFEYEEVYRKMKEMLPRATRTSFYQILEGINHDVRNFLIRMKQALMDVRENSERLYKRERNTINVRVKDIERNIRNVTNLLKLFNFRNPGKEAININALIEELTYFFKTRESESIHFNTKELEDRIPIITCNKAELSMIIYNLFSNAVHAIVEKNITNGEIMITTDFIYGEYIIVVEDNGVGIDNKDISHIYEAGFSRKEGGLGIGLYFIYETLRKSFWGTIECESQYGQWTKFTIKIPESVNYKED